MTAVFILELVYTLYAPFVKPNYFLIFNLFLPQLLPLRLQEEEPLFEETKDFFEWGFY